MAKAIALPVAKNYWSEDTWAGPSTTWFSWAFLNETNFKDHRNQYNDTVHWIQTHLPSWESDAMWKKVNDCFYIRLRNEQDAVLFTLKFGKNKYDE